MSIGQRGMFKAHTVPSQSLRSSSQAHLLAVSANPTETTRCVKQHTDRRQLSQASHLEFVITNVDCTRHYPRRSLGKGSLLQKLDLDITTPPKFLSYARLG